MEKVMSFKILEFDNVHKTMVIDWGWTILNHHIPSQIIENPDISEEEAMVIIERERPEKPEPIDIPLVLQRIHEKNSMTSLNNESNDDEDMI